MLTTLVSIFSDKGFPIFRGNQFKGNNHHQKVVNYPVLFYYGKNIVVTIFLKEDRLMFPASGEKAQHIDSKRKINQVRIFHFPSLSNCQMPGSMLPATTMLLQFTHCSFFASHAWSLQTELVFNCCRME